MKVLFISKADLPDFQNDMIFHGGRSVLGENFIDYNKLWYMYKNDKNQYWDTRVPENGRSYGRGFTLYGQFDDINIDRSNIKEKIENHFFDKIIYGSFTRCWDFIEDVVKFYDRKDIILVDGEDDQNIREDVLQYGTYYKRELVHKPTEFLKPIYFAIPKNLIVSEMPNKSRDYATIIPGDLSTYIYDDEASYFEGYQKSWFGVTFKKGGWDCLRHYEILMNGCIPFFPNLNECPEYTMFMFPKDLIIKCNSNISELSEDDLINYTNQLIDYTRNYLTTEKLFNYIIND
jgi:hypothetical protein